MGKYSATLNQNSYLCIANVRNLKTGNFLNADA